MKQKAGTLGSGQEWSLENLHDGLQYFFELHGRYPKSDEVDEFEYLPSARAIQRSYGGLVALRTKLGLSGPVDFTRGDTRSTVAGIAIRRSQDYEEEFYHYLISNIPEVRVHEHKVLRPGNISTDFFIYLDGKEGIVIDLFYAENISNLGKIINIKLKQYIKTDYPVYLVLVRNAVIQQLEIDTLMKNRRISLPKNIYVLTEESFKKILINLLTLK